MQFLVKYLNIMTILTYLFSIYKFTFIKAVIHHTNNYCFALSNYLVCITWLIYLIDWWVRFKKVLSAYFDAVRYDACKNVLCNWHTNICYMFCLFCHSFLHPKVALSTIWNRIIIEFLLVWVCFMTVFNLTLGNFRKRTPQSLSNHLIMK